MTHVLWSDICFSRVSFGEGRSEAWFGHPPRGRDIKGASPSPGSPKEAFQSAFVATGAGMLAMIKMSSKFVYLSCDKLFDSCVYHQTVSRALTLLKFGHFISDLPVRFTYLCPLYINYCTPPPLVLGDICRLPLILAGTQALVNLSALFRNPT